jgi:hypothetical protein
VFQLAMDMVKFINDEIIDLFHAMDLLQSLPGHASPY